MRWSCLQFIVLLLPESYRRLSSETRGYSSKYFLQLYDVMHTTSIILVEAETYSVPGMSINIIYSTYCRCSTNRVFALYFRSSVGLEDILV